MRKPPFVAGRGKMIQVDENHYTGVGKIYAVGDVAGAPCIFFIYVSYYNLSYFFIVLNFVIF